MKHAEAQRLFNPHPLWSFAATYRTHGGRLSGINGVVRCASMNIAGRIEQMIVGNHRRSYGGKLNTTATRIEE